LLRSLLVTLFILISSCAQAKDQSGKGGTHPSSEQNTELSRLLSRLSLIQTAGLTHGSGQFFVKIFAVSKGEECDVHSNLCEGVDLLVSVRSPDLYGDHALYKITGLQDWKFVTWNQYAEEDSPEHFTSFDVSGRWKGGHPTLSCRNTPREGS